MSAPKLGTAIKLDRPLAILDSEYSSLDRDKQRLVSLGIILLLPDGDPIRWARRFNPESPIDPETTAVHGIDDAEARRHQPFRDHAATVAKLLTGHDWGGYRLRGDIEVLLKEFNIAKVTLSTTGVRLVDGLRLLQIKEPRALTDTFTRLTGETPEQAGLRPHDALSDANMALAVIEHLHADRTVAEIQEESFPGMVDLLGKFKRDDAGVVRFTFGKHDGEPVAHHRDYLDWITTPKANFHFDTVQWARRFLRGGTG